MTDPTWIFIIFGGLVLAVSASCCGTGSLNASAFANITAGILRSARHPPV